jgi:hypothetical protein
MMVSIIAPSSVRWIAEANNVPLMFRSKQSGPRIPPRPDILWRSVHPTAPPSRFHIVMVMAAVKLPRAVP